MVITIEKKARPCPGVERAISLAEDALRHGETVYSIGALIHNNREIERLSSLGLKQIHHEDITDDHEYESSDFLVRAHGERQAVVDKARDCGLSPIDATCRIVKHSQDLVEEHVRDGWRIIIVGKREHPEVLSLLDRTNGNGSVVSNVKTAETEDYEQRSLLMAQSTVDPDLFKNVRQALSKRLSNLKIVDTTCRFIRTRQKDLQAFGKEQDVVIIVGGKQSSNCRMLHQSILAVNERAYYIESPSEIDWAWLKETDHVGITGGASTPKWQMEEVKTTLENHRFKENPKGLKNRKGGTFLWWMKKKSSKTK
jgi:4-hydroxy-3-methylbut-2-enyl diphosphate reductase